MFFFLRNAAFYVYYLIRVNYTIRLFRGSRQNVSCLV